jgi:hypothetical protein
VIIQLQGQCLMSNTHPLFLGIYLHVYSRLQWYGTLKLQDKGNKVDGCTHSDQEKQI